MGISAKRRSGGQRYQTGECELSGDLTRRKKRYKFDMTEREVHECIKLLRALNPDMATGFPKGSRIVLQSLPNTRDLGAIITRDGRHILPRRLLRSGELYLSQIRLKRYWRNLII